MTKKRKPRRVRGLPGRARAARELRLIRDKERELRAVILRLRALESVINDATFADLDVCFREVRRLAIAPKGLLSEKFRKELWPFLLTGQTVTRAKLTSCPHTEISAVKTHRDTAQVEKDVARSLWHYDILQGINESERRSKRRALTRIIMGVLNANDELFYFQGYHDIVSVFLLTLGYTKNTLQAVQNVSETYHREPMRSGFEQVMGITRLLFPLLDAADELLYQHLHESRVEPFFALPWIITWFAHQLRHFEDVARLYDVFLVTHPLFSLYVSASILIESRDTILRSELDFGTMHAMLSKLPLSMDIEKVISGALVLYHQLPPIELRQRCNVEFATISKMFYFTFPFEYQPWPSFTSPVLEEVPPLPLRQQHRRDSDNAGYKLGFWQISVVFTAVAVGLVGVAFAYTFRDRIGSKG